MTLPYDGIFASVRAGVNNQVGNMLVIADVMQTNPTWVSSFYYPVIMIYENKTSQWAKIEKFTCFRELYTLITLNLEWQEVQS